jgi:RND family efflux transporter MFP subunit
MQGLRTLLPIIPFLLLGVAFAPGCKPSEASAASGAQEGTQREASALTQVVSIEVAQQDLSISITMPGSVTALKSVDVFAKIGGFLQEIAVDIGDEVKSGDLLAEINVPEMQAVLQQQEAEVISARALVAQRAAEVTQSLSALAAVKAEQKRVEASRRQKEAEVLYRQAEFDRLKLLLDESPSIEKSRLDEARYRQESAEAALSSIEADLVAAAARIGEAEAAVTSAREVGRATQALVPVADAKLEEARALMRYARISAPFAGIITKRHVDPGDFIRDASTNGSAAPLLRLESVDRLRIRVDVPMDSVAALSVGDPVVFDNIAAAPGLRLEGAITRTAGSLGERSRMMKAEVELDNPRDGDGARRLRSGDYGSLTIHLESHPGTPTVPAAAVFSRGDDLYVFTVSDDRVHERRIVPLYRDGILVGVAEGLKPGELVVASGTAALEDGQRVLPVAAKAKSR